jgi:cytochrome P450 family 135
MRILGAISSPGPALPAGPRLPSVVQTYLFSRWAVAFLSGAQRRYGDVFTIRLVGLGDGVVIADPELVREVMSGSPEVFRAGEANPRLRTLMGSDSLFALDGEAHLKTRRRVLPALLGDATRAHEALVARLTAECLGTWPIGRPISMYQESRKIMSEAILRVAVGTRDSPPLHELRQALARVVRVTPLISPSYVYPRLHALPPWRSYWRTVDRMRTLIDRLIDAREHDDPSREAGDTLSILLNACEGDRAWAREQVMTLALSGHESMTVGLTWAVDLLARHPRARIRAREQGSRYLDAVVIETLRMRNIPGAARKLAEPATIGPYSFPAGVTLFPLALLMSRDPRRFEEPSEFRPERWLDRRPGTYTWIPFGGGQRRCAGAAFAQMALRTALGTMLERIDWEPVGRRAERQRSAYVTLVPARGGLILRTR